MNRSILNLKGFTIGATDGEIGKVKEFYFDDQTWTIRYLIVETGNWLLGRKVLISPIAILMPDYENKIFPINLTKEQIKNSPVVDTDKPVSRQQELEMYSYYPWGSIWRTDLNAASTPQTTEEIILEEKKYSSIKKRQGDPNLRSTEHVTGYKINADYGDVGKVDDFIVDVKTWKIDFIVVNTTGSLGGKKVLIPPNWIKDINWDNSEVIVTVTADSIKDSPAHTPG